MSDFDDYMTPSEERATAIIKRQADEIDRMRAALRIFACACTVSERCAVPDNCRNFQARRALEASNG